MYLRSHRVDGLFFVECFGQLQDDRSLTYKVRCECPRAPGQYIPLPEWENQNKELLKHSLKDLLTDSTYPNANLKLDYRRHDSFTYEVTLKKNFNVGVESIEYVMDEKNIGDQLFDLTYSNVLKFLL